MHKKIIASLLLTSVLSFSQELNNEKFQLVAKNIDSKNNIVTATGEVVVFSPSYYLSADKIVYNKENESFELFDNVIIIKDNNIQTQSNYAFVDLKSDAFKQNPLFLYEASNNLWVNSKTSDKQNDVIQLNKSIISACDCVDPAWSIRVSSADYDIKDKWINAYNTRLYIKNVPVLYSPYFGFSTDKSRRTGLLIPTIGYSNDDGLYYAQPIYYAPSADLDIEVIPQLRNRRGYGAYTYLRYADSAYSTLNLKAGGFREDKDFQEQAGLKNQKHFGWNVDYERTKLFSNENTQDGLYASINFMNDIEYKTLENEEDSTSTDKKIESKINYFYNTPKYYGGLYARYYIDTSKNSNDSTLQELPQIQLHKYNEELGFKKLLYSLDTKFMNYTRQDGLNANIYEVSLPINYTKYFFDDYLYLTVENKTVISKYNYTNSDSITYNNGTLVQNESSVLVGTDLIKPYEDYLHTINLTAKYSYPKNVKKDGDLYNITTEDNSLKESELKAFPIAQGSKNINLSVNQSLYNKDSLKQIVNHKMSQSILYDKNDKPRLQNLENYVKVNHDFGSVSAKVVYNVQDKHFIENTADATFNYENLSLSAGYYKSKQTENSNKEDLESLRYKASYKIAKDYKIGYYENYNILDKVKNKQGVNLNIDDRCWNLDLKYEKKIVPSTSTSSEGINQTIVYLNLELKPIGGVKQKYKIEDKN